MKTVISPILLVGALAAVLGAGCITKEVPAASDCDAGCEVDAGIDAPSGCATNSNVCTGENLNCVDDVCRDCASGDERESTDCDDRAAPICGTDFDCRACQVHEECASGVCDDGTCATGVLYVKTGGSDSGNCADPATPCETLRYVIGLVPTPASTPANRRFIKVLDRGDISQGGEVNIDDKAVVIIGAPVISAADPARSSIRRGGNGRLMHIHGGAVVRIERLSISNASNNATADAILCESSTFYADGIEVDNNNGTGIISDNCTFTLLNSVVSRSEEGGVNAQGGRVVIVNNWIVDNGAANSSYGGLLVLGAVDPSSVVQFNTVINNQSATTQSDGIDCQVGGITVRNTLIYGNATQNRVSGTCVFANTVYGPTDPGLRLVGANDNRLEAAFVAYGFADAANRDYHISATSVANGAGSATGIAAEAATDIDGDARLTTTPDVGADELP